jgi:hypothetical protein
MSRECGHRGLRNLVLNQISNITPQSPPIAAKRQRRSAVRVRAGRNHRARNEPKAAVSKQRGQTEDRKWERNYEAMRPEIVEPAPKERRRYRRRRRKGSASEANERYIERLREREREQIIDVTPGATETHASSSPSPRAGQYLQPYSLEWYAERERRIAAGMKVKFMDRCAEWKIPRTCGLGFSP